MVRWRSRDRYIARTAPLREWLGSDEVRFDDFVRYVCQTPDEELDVHWRPQIALIGNREKGVNLDFIGHVERIEEDWNFVCQMLGVEAPIFHENRNAHRAHRDYYHEDTWERVRARYQDDIELFGYEDNRFAEAPPPASP